MSDLTFCILAYKVSPYLEDCIQSLLKQKEKAEILICSSTPNTFIKEIAEKYQLPLAINKNSHGIADDWNFAIKQAKTKYVTLAHQDDIYLENYSEIMLKGIEKYPHFLIKFSGYKELINNKIRNFSVNFFIKNLIIALGFKTKKALSKSEDKTNFIRFGSAIPCPSVMYNLKNLNQFCFSQEMKINLDWQAWIDLANLSGEFLYTKEKLIVHRIHLESATSQGIALKQRQKEDRKCFSQLWSKNIARLLIFLYTLSYQDNKVS